MHIMVCVSGFAKTGKDEFCKQLVKNWGAVHTGLIDPGKRHVADLYEFSEEQLFGPSEFRNKGDLRYPKNSFHEMGFFRAPAFGENVWATLKPNDKIIRWRSDDKDYGIIETGDPRFWLSPREVLQKYGEIMNDMYTNTWVDKGIKTHLELASGPYNKAYSRMNGIIDVPVRERPSPFITCFSDFRHWHEIRAVRKLENVKSVLVRIRSKRVPNPPFDHRSETEQLTIPDSTFDYVIMNDGTLESFQRSADTVINSVLNNPEQNSTNYIKC